MFMAQADIKISDFEIAKDEVEQIKWIKKQDLIADVKTHPEKYVPSIATSLEIIYPEFKYL